MRSIPVPKKPLTKESSAWQYLADKLDAQGKMSLYEDSYTRLHGDKDLCKGLCAEIAMLVREGAIAESVRWEMDSRISTALAERNATPFNVRRSRYDIYLFKPKQVAPRIVFAQLNAFLAKQDERGAARRASQFRHDSRAFSL